MSGRAGIYVRVSVDRSKASESPERQEAACRDLAVEKGLDVVDVYVERNLSGWSGVKRPQFDRLLEDAESGRIDTVLVWKVSRLTRQGLVGLSKVVQHGTRIVSVEDHIDSSLPGQTTVLVVLGEAAQQQSKDTSDFVKKAASAEARAGKLHGGIRPYGYNRDGSIIEAEAAVIREVADRVLRNGESFRQIAMDLNSRGIGTSRDLPWSSNVLARMMRTQRLAGVRVHGDERYEAAFPAILTPAQHQALVATRSMEPRSTAARYLLAGLVRCSICGGAMKVLGGANRTYCCVKNPGRMNCGKQGISKARLEELVVETVFTALTTAHETPDRTDGTPVATREQLLARVTEAESDMTDLTTARYVTKVIPTDEAYLAALVPLTERVESATAALAAMDDEAARADAVSGLKPGSRSDLEAWWAAASEPERREAVHSVVTGIVVRPPVKLGHVFDPTRAAIAVDWNLLLRIADRAPADSIGTGLTAGEQAEIDADNEEDRRHLIATGGAPGRTE